MTDPQPGTSTKPQTAGALLRQARQAQGMHIAMLAASIKVPQRKLEALEADRYQELPDNTYTRALAKTVCRTLKIDAAPVLSLLPPATDYSLEQVLHGLNTPFRDRPGRTTPTRWSMLTRPALWGPAALVLAALVVYLLPQNRHRLEKVQDSASLATAASGSMATAASASATVAATPASTQVPASAASVPEVTTVKASPIVEEPLQLKTTAASWVEVRDANDDVLLQRLLQPGEAVSLGGTFPLYVTVGNVAHTHLSLRGRVINLSPLARHNVARVELQ